MINDIKNILTTLVETYSENIYRTPGMLLAFLSDMAPSLIEERRFMKMCADAKIFDVVLQANSETSANKELAVKKAVSTMEQTYLMRPASASMIISWITASLGWNTELGDFSSEPYNEQSDSRSVPEEETLKSEITSMESLGDTANEAEEYSQSYMRGELENLKLLYESKEEDFSITDNGIWSQERILTCYNGSDEVVIIPKYVTEIDGHAFSEYLFKANGDRSENLKKITRIIIPERCKHIGDNAFGGCRKLEHIIIPENVESIGKNVFSDGFYCCKNLNCILVDDKNSNYSNDDRGVLFNKDKTVLLQYPAGNLHTTYRVPDCVQIIEENAFYGCENLRKIILPDGLKEIRKSAFEYCDNLREINIPKSIINISAFTFSYCHSLQKISMPNVLHVGEGAFRGCYLLTEIIHPALLTKADDAFEDTVYANIDDFEINNNVLIHYKGNSHIVGIPCNVQRITRKALLQSEFTQIYLPDSVREIEDDTFLFLDKLDCIHVEKFNPIYTSINGVLYNREITELICCRNPNLQKMEIPFGVVKIHRHAFCNSKRMEPPDIGEAERILRFRVRKIEYAKPLSIKIPSTVQEIDTEAFCFDDRLISIDVDPANNKYSSVDGILYNKDQTELICYPPGRQQKGFSLPEQVQKICPHAFSRCRNLESVRIADSVIKIGEYSFENCSQLIKVIIGKHVKKIGCCAFAETPFSKSAKGRLVLMKYHCK